MNGCTLWIDSLFGVSWKTCCDVHDMEYANFTPRLDADMNLFHCVASKAWWLLPMAALMLVGVRLFGYYFYIKGDKT